MPRHSDIWHNGTCQNGILCKDDTHQYDIRKKDNEHKDTKQKGAQKKGTRQNGILQMKPSGFTIYRMTLRRKILDKMSLKQY